MYVIAEDVVAVDGEQGDLFRAQWNARYESSAPFRTLLARLDWLWGISGVLVGGAVIGVIFGVKEDTVGWAVGESLHLPSTLKKTPNKSTSTNTNPKIGWSVPWIWAAVMMLVTISMTKSTCKQENQIASRVGSEP